MKKLKKEWVLMDLNEHQPERFDKPSKTELVKRLKEAKKIAKKRAR